MRRCTDRERNEFIYLFMRHAKITGNQHEGMLQRAATRLLRYGATLGRIAENQCNGYQTPGKYGVWDGVAEDADRRKYNRISAKVTELCAEFGCKPVFQGDPRGNTLKIQVPDGYTNDWGKEGICVPTS